MFSIYRVSPLASAIMQVYFYLPFLATLLSPVFPFFARSFSVIIQSRLPPFFCRRPPRRDVLRLKVSRHSQPFPRIPVALFLPPSSGASAVLTHSPLFPRFLPGNDYSPVFVIPPFRTCPLPLVSLLLHTLFNASPSRRC